MTRMVIKRFSAPDDTRPFVDKGRLELIRLGEETVGRGIFEPGWRWSVDVAPIYRVRREGWRAISFARGT